MRRLTLKGTDDGDDDDDDDDDGVHHVGEAHARVVVVETVAHEQTEGVEKGEKKKLDMELKVPEKCQSTSKGKYVQCKYW